MKNCIPRNITALLCLALFSASAEAGPTPIPTSPLPPNVTANLAHREQSLSNLTFAGDMALRNKVSPEPPEIITSQQRAMARYDQQLFGQAKGAVSKTALEKMIKQNDASIAESGVGRDISSTHPWTLTRMGSQTLAKGILQDSPDIISAYSQYYVANNVLILDKSAEIPVPQPIEPDSPIVFSVPGDAIRYRYPTIQEGLGLMPEDFVMLAGANPLSLYGASWHLMAQTPENWTVTTHVNHGNNAPFDITMTLDRSRDGVPTKILVKGSYEDTRYEALQFKQQEGVWICSKYRRVENSLGLLRERDWSLSSVTPSRPIEVSLKRPVLVSDYRLFGPNLTFGAMHQAEGKNSADIIRYQWKGKFPSVADLQSLHDQKHPGESTPDPGDKSSMLPTIAGMLCLVGGILTYRRRDKATPNA